MTAWDLKGSLELHGHEFKVSSIGVTLCFSSLYSYVSPSLHLIFIPYSSFDFCKDWCIQQAKSMFAICN